MPQSLVEALRETQAALTRLRHAQPPLLPLGAAHGLLDRPRQLRAVLGVLERRVQVELVGSN